MKHREIRAAVLSALKENISERVSWFDGRPVFIDEQELPAVAVYLTDASAADEFVDEGTWEATLHIEVFLRAKEPDSVLDMWMEEKILPALEAGRAVILDRFVDSTMAFQGFGRQLGRELVETVNELATGGLTPDITFVFLLAPKEARERMAGKELDRMELEAEAFRNRVYEGYCRLGEMYPDRVVLLDARADIDTLSRKVQEVLRERICKK